MSAMFSIVPIFIFIIFVIVIVGFISVFVKGISQWSKNNNSPELTVDAIVVSKRDHVSVSDDFNQVDHMSHTSSSTSYYVTFEVESGDRMEFMVKGEEYGMLVEGDVGRLTFQGTRYKGFVRKR